MANLRHGIKVNGWVIDRKTGAGKQLPRHQAMSECGRIVNYGAMPNVPHSDPRYCPKCLEIMRITIG
jgi:hypothetical protein